MLRDGVTISKVVNIALSTFACPKNTKEGPKNMNSGNEHDWGCVFQKSDVYY
jgi:hypothetical protein